jgi:hypothetical protein
MAGSQDSSGENVKKHKKIIQKIVKRMIDKDGSVVVTGTSEKHPAQSPEADEYGNKLIMLHAADHFRKHYFAQSGGDMTTPDQSPQKAHFPIVRVVHVPTTEDKNTADDAGPSAETKRIDDLKKLHTQEITALEARFEAEHKQQEEAMRARLALRAENKK